MRVRHWTRNRYGLEVNAKDFTNRNPAVTMIVICHQEARISEARSMNYRFNATRLVAIAAFFATLAVSTVTLAQSLKVKGNIISRAGNTMTMKTTDGQNVVVVLNDSTDVQQLQGAFKARKKD